MVLTVFYNQKSLNHDSHRVCNRLLKEESTAPNVLWLQRHVIGIKHLILEVDRQPMDSLKIKAIEAFFHG